MLFPTGSSDSVDNFTVEAQGLSIPSIEMSTLVSVCEGSETVRVSVFQLTMSTTFPLTEMLIGPPMPGTFSRRRVPPVTSQNTAEVVP
jgi:hypothetical protein